MKKNDSNLFYTCSLIELIGRSTRQKRKDVVKLMGEKTIRHIYHHADTLHCEPIAKIADYYIDFCHIPTGEFDNIASCKYSVPSYWEIGKVYARLIEDIQKDDVIFALIRVYNSTVSDSISYYNSDFFYQPRGFIKEQFLSEENAVSGETSKKPAIRFRGFTDAWEQRKLGEMAVFSKGYGYSKNDLQESGTPIILYGRLYTKYKTIIDEVDTFVADRKGSIYSKGGEVIVPASGETAEDIAIASVVEHKDVILGGDLNVISPLAGLCSPFLALTISHGKPHCDLAKKAQGKSVVHLHNTDLQEIDIFYPSTREQTQIGIFFRSLDDLIALHQRKHEKLGSIKKALLEKMFPKNGTKFPEIRFSGFTDAWEQRELGKTCEITTGGTPSTSISDYWNPKEIPWLSSGEVHKKRISQTDEKISRLGLENSSTRWVKPFSVLIALAGQGKTRGTVAINEIALTTNQSIAAIYPAEHDAEFLFQNLESRYAELRAISSADGSRGGLNKNLLSAVSIPYTERREQQKIGAFFRGIDRLITLHQRELEKLRNIKKTCLEKMFV